MSADAAVRSTDLVSLMSELGGTPSGRPGALRWRCIVPSHDDENPSTTVFEDSHGKQRWKCWSCGHAGTAIDALVEARSMSVADAISTLEHRTGTACTTPSPLQRRAPVLDNVPLSTEACSYLEACAERLWQPEGTTALRWLERRGLTVEVLRNNLVGFDPGPRDLDRAPGLPGHMTAKPRLPGGSGVTFVSFDQPGEPLHVQCRLLHPTSFKYVNPRREHGSIPPVSFPRTDIAYGPLVVTEGVADGLIAATAGFRSASVTSATTVRRSTAEQLVTHSNGELIVLAFDNDVAGNTATTQLKALLGERAAILKLPAGSDLTDTYQQRTDPPWQAEMTSQGALTR